MSQPAAHSARRAVVVRQTSALAGETRASFVTVGRVRLSTHLVEADDAESQSGVKVLAHLAPVRDFHHDMPAPSRMNDGGRGVDIHEVPGDPASTAERHLKIEWDADGLQRVDERLHVWLQLESVGVRQIETDPGAVARPRHLAYVVERLRASVPTEVVGEAANDLLALDCHNLEWHVGHLDDTPEGDVDRVAIKPVIGRNGVHHDEAVLERVAKLGGHLFFRDESEVILGQCKIIRRFQSFLDIAVAEYQVILLSRFVYVVRDQVMSL